MIIHRDYLNCRKSFCRRGMQRTTCMWVQLDLEDFKHSLRSLPWRKHDKVELYCWVYLVVQNLELYS